MIQQLFALKQVLFCVEQRPMRSTKFAKTKETKKFLKLICQISSTAVMIPIAMTNLDP